MAKKTVKINEEQLKDIIKEAVGQVMGNAAPQDNSNAAKALMAIEKLQGLTYWIDRYSKIPQIDELPQVNNALRYWANQLLRALPLEGSPDVDAL